MASLLRCFSFFSKDKRDATPNLVKQIRCSDINDQNLGINIAGGKMLVVIPGNNSKIPIKMNKILNTSKDNQSRLTIKVFEGANALSSENILLGKLTLVGIPPAPKGVAKFNVCFDIDVEGTLKVSVVHTVFHELKNEITITNDQRRSAKMLNAKNKLKLYANDVKQTLGDPRYEEALKAADKKHIMHVANETVKWLNNNQSATFYEYKARHTKLEVLWNPIITEVHKLSGGPSSVPPKVVDTESSCPTAKTGSILNEVD